MSNSEEPVTLHSILNEMASWTEPCAVCSCAKVFCIHLQQSMPSVVLRDHSDLNFTFSRFQRDERERDGSTCASVFCRGRTKAAQSSQPPSAADQAATAAGTGTSRAFLCLPAPAQPSCSPHPLARSPKVTTHRATPGPAQPSWPRPEPAP